MEHIDLVIAYVNNRDELWLKIYNEYCIKNDLREKLIDVKTDRYEDIGLINYQLKLINKHLPWVHKIYLLLMNKGQEPKNLPSNVEIVYHAKFIPQKFLPTFNSTTIEMFLWNIPNLSEKFIYANDDMLPFRDLKPTNFFDGDKVRIDWWHEDIRECRNMFRHQCLNSYKHLAYKLGKKVEDYKYIRPAHSWTPMIKSHCASAYRLLEDLITKHIRAFRTVYQYNQYIYPLFEYFVFGTSESKIDFLYTQLQEDIDLEHDIVCLNIIPKEKEKRIIEELEKRI